MKTLPGGVCAPAGFQAAGVTGGIKHAGAARKDCALVYSTAPSTIAGCFTTNLLKAPPVVWTEGVCIRGQGRAVFINSGNANACTGTRGLDDAKAIAEEVSAKLGVAITEVCVLSTGVIGVPLPMDRVRQGIGGCVETLGENGGSDAAEAIMTTDTVRKEHAVAVELSSGTVRIGAMAKGSGMIAPNMATMFGIFTTDAAILPNHLKALMRQCVAESFNCICVDNDMSTSDCVLCLANGQSRTDELAPGSDDWKRFAEAFDKCCVHMAQWLVKDGEGATKFVEITVAGALDDAEAKLAARAVAQSMLCKTAFNGSDPNWGRIACAVGYSGAHFRAEELSIQLNGLEVVHGGLPTMYEEADAAAIFREPSFAIHIDFGHGRGHARFWTSDLSRDYVSINADYRS